MALVNRSTFPHEIDTFAELYDLPPSKVVGARRFQELKQKPSLTTLEQEELNALVVDLGNYIITPETWNKFADALVNVETFFTQEVMEFIEAKQVEWTTYVKNFKYVGIHNSSNSYKAHNQVKFNGDLYLVVQDVPSGTAISNGKYWTKTSSKGDKGDVGISVSYKGAYNAETTYTVGDAVDFEGLIYYARVETTGVSPSDRTTWILWDKIVVSHDEPQFPQRGMMWIKRLD